MPGFQALEPAALAFGEGGSLYSPRFGDVYAAADGPLAQARHVFLGGNELPARWKSCRQFVILETGFGAGLNFLATWLLWRQGAPANARLHFVTVEKHPFQCGDLRLIHDRFPELGHLASELHARYPVLLPGFHRLHLDGGRVTLTLLFGEAAAMLAELEAGADAFFLDGFAPARNPAMWDAAVFSQLARLANPGSTLATYTVASSVRAGLADAGFALEKRPGFATKREMLVGRFHRDTARGRTSPERKVIVVGAGLAGTACAHRLAERGWDVSLLEKHAGPAREASGNPAGLVRPVLSLDWNAHSRFTTAGFLYAIRHHAGLSHSGFPIDSGQGGVLQVARDAARFEKQQRMVEAFALPAGLLATVDQREAEALAGVPVAGPGWWFPHAVWAGPASMCQANLGAAARQVDAQFGAEVAAMRRENGDWQAIDAAGRVIAQAPVAILANAHAAGGPGLGNGLPLRRVRGQISVLPQRTDRNLRIAVCREGYITPGVQGVHYLGASFNEGMFEESERREDHQSNLLRLEKMLPGFGDGIEAAALSGRVAFRTMAPDRLPIVGELAGQPGLHACVGLGSRGMTWAALAAELLASRICGDPLPLERSLVAGIDAARFKTRPVLKEG